MRCHQNPKNISARFSFDYIGKGSGEEGEEEEVEEEEEEEEDWWLLAP
jgi:hypothetical protein